jgi:signal transduction histidine kinase
MGLVMVPLDGSEVQAVAGISPEVKVSNNPLLALVVGVLLLLGIVVAVAAFTFQSERGIERQGQLFEASLRLARVFLSVQDVETGQRGYLLTLDDAYLGPYENAVKAIPERIEAYRDVMVDIPDQRADLERLQALIPEKLAEIAQTVALAREGRTQEAIALVRNDRGRELMDRIRATIVRMRDRQTVWRADAAADQSRSATLLRFGVALVAFGVVVLGIYTFSEKRRQRIALEAQLQQVEGHSMALEETNRLLTSEIETRKAAEDQIRQMQRIEAVGQLTGGLAHDFNNMLAVILSALGLARRRLAGGDTNVNQFIDAAVDATNRAATLTRRLLAFARQQPLNPETIDANKLVADMSELLRRTLGETVQLETVLAGGLWRVYADASQIENSILNLAVNARDAMPDGGKITIETANCDLDERYAAQNTGAKAGQYVMIAVSDTGSGMSPQVMQRAFEPFFTTKGVGKGTGLGLSQVYGFIKQSDGHIKIYSEPAQGTTVKLYLPRYFVQGEEVPVRRATSPEAAQNGNRELVLVVEDEERVRALSADSLREIGYEVIVAEGGKVALEKLRQNPDVALLFTDIVMPEMTGRVLADEATKLRPGIKVLYTTGFTRNAVVHNGILDPGVNFIAKPFTLEQLAAKVRSVLDG